MKFFKRENWPVYLAFTIILSVYCMITVVLFLNTFISSFKPQAEFFMQPWKLPKAFILDNYRRLFRDGFMNYYRNSLTIMICSIVSVLAISAPAAYGLGRFKFRGNNALRLYFLIGMMFPGQLAIIPLFNLVKGLGLINKLGGLFVVYTAGVGVPIFLLTKFTLTIPESLRESAKIDGASEFKIFTRIFLPLMRPGLGALIPLTAIGFWNDFFLPLIFITAREARTIPLGLRRYHAESGFSLEFTGVMFAAMTITILPLVLLYIIGSRNIISGITLGSVKQ